MALPDLPPEARGCVYEDELGVRFSSEFHDVVKCSPMSAFVRELIGNKIDSVGRVVIASRNPKKVTLTDAVIDSAAGYDVPVEGIDFSLGVEPIWNNVLAVAAHKAKATVMGLKGDFGRPSAVFATDILTLRGGEVLSKMSRNRPLSGKEIEKEKQYLMKHHSEPQCQVWLMGVVNSTRVGLDLAARALVARYGAMPSSLVRDCFEEEVGACVNRPPRIDFLRPEIHQYYQGAKVISITSELMNEGRELSDYLMKEPAYEYGGCVPVDNDNAFKLMIMTGLPFVSDEMVRLGFDTVNYQWQL